MGELLLAVRMIDGRAYAYPLRGYYEVRSMLRSIDHIWASYEQREHWQPWELELAEMRGAQRLLSWTDLGGVE